MKKILFFLFFIHISIFSNAQTVAVAAEKMNILYIGICNPITIAVEGIADERLNVSIIKGDIKKISRGHYDVHVSGSTEAIIIVEYDGKKVEQKFRCKPMPIITYAFTGCSICRPDGIEVVFDHCDFDIKCTVQSYSLVYIPKKGEPVQLNNKGPQFNTAVNNLMSKAKVGDMFQFNTIRSICPADDMMPMSNTLNYIVKN